MFGVSGIVTKVVIAMVTVTVMITMEFTVKVRWLVSQKT